ncbi:hypothetical protein NT05LI_3627, partial [Listeria ivanovii FSL F6-596]
KLATIKMYKLEKEKWKVIIEMKMKILTRNDFFIL